MRLDGTRRRWLTDDDTKDQIAGDWSPDGQRVAFLYSMSADGGGRRLITETVTTYKSFDLVGLPA